MNSRIFVCAVLNCSLWVTSVIAAKPVFTLQPTGVGVEAGSAATFMVAVTGSPTFQWQQSTDGVSFTNLTEGELLSGAIFSGVTTDVLNIANVQISQVGTRYQVVATNAEGSTTSHLGELIGTFTVDASIHTQPLPTTQTVAAGSTVTLTVVAAGGPRPTFQWRRGATVLTEGLQAAGSTLAFASSYNDTEGVNLTSSVLTITNATSGDAGTDYNVVVSNTTETGDHSQTSKNVVLKITTGGKLAETITFAGPANQAFRATPIALVATASSNLAVSFSVLAGPATIANNNLTMTGIGSVTVRASQAGNASYSAAAVVDRTFVISKASPVITWSTPAAIGYGVALSGGQLNATADIGGTFTYSPVAGSVLNAGTQTLGVTFTPTDTVKYSGVNIQRSLTVSPAAATVALGSMSAIYTGTAQAAKATTLPAGLSVGVTYNGGTSAPIAAGAYAVVATVSDVNYTGSASGTLTVAKATPTITWATPAAMNAGSTLTPTQLNASASVAGSFSYSPAIGSVLTQGTQTLNATFAPTDAANYNPATASVKVLVQVPGAVPVFTINPTTQSAALGLAVTLNCLATSVTSYQWQKNGVNVSGATGSSYTIANLSAGDAGSYRAIATNSVGSATSNAAVLTVVPRVSSKGGASTGDFDGDGLSDLVWQNTLTGERSIWLMNGTVLKLGVSLGMFAPDWTIVAVGDFNHDGQVDLVWQNTITGERSIWLMNGTNLKVGVDLGTYSTDVTIMAAADFNGDGETDIVVQNISSGERTIWLMNGTTKVSEVSLGTVPMAWSIAGAADFNGDGKMDLLWQNAATGERSVWLMNGTAVGSTVSLGIVARQLQIVGTGDYNQDGQTDLVWTDTQTGERSIWLMNGTTHTSTAALATISFDWSLGRPIFLTAQTPHADFNGDGQTDLIWQNRATGERSITLMNGTGIVSTVSLGIFPANWVISGTGDFNHDEKPDLVWTNTTTGERSVWLMDGTTLISNVPLATVPANWVVSAIADFNYDGKPDLVWTNTTTGERAIWLMNGTVFGSGIALGTVPTAWSIATTADLNGDGKTDIIWQNKSTGECSVWLMNGGVFSAGVALDTLPPQWSIVGSGDFDGDGKADLILENTATGEKAVRMMNRTTFNTTVSIGTFPTSLSVRN